MFNGNACHMALVYKFESSQPWLSWKMNCDSCLVTLVYIHIFIYFHFYDFRLTVWASKIQLWRRKLDIIIIVSYCITRSHKIIPSGKKSSFMPSLLTNLSDVYCLTVLSLVILLACFLHLMLITPISIC
jgi:hypothetical protein